MKKYLILLILAFAIVACEEEEDPVQNATACFDYSPKTDVTTGTEITFSNCSQDAISYLWSFGDGNTSTMKEPKHTFQNEGIYEVTLMAQNEELEDVNADGIINFDDGTITRDMVSQMITVQ